MALGLYIFLLPTMVASLSLQVPLAMSTYPNSTCQFDAIPHPNITGTARFTMVANLVQDYSKVSLLPGTDVVARHLIDFCNVTVTYGHVGWNDTINVSVWLPTGGWNDRLLGIGGGGYSSTLGAVYHTAAVSQGFVAMGTDSGHPGGLEFSADPSLWALTGVSNSNYYLIEDFGSRSLGELAAIGKHVAENFYGHAPRASYFTGCSGGGRQAFALAQRYPGAFDGLLASSPAINMESAIPAAYFASQMMKTNHYYPSPCEVNAFTEAAVKACDMLDGVNDGIISAPQDCSFSADDVVGQEFSCNGTQYTFTAEAAKIVQAAWTGPENKGIFWYPYNKDADLTSAIISTACDNQSLDCTGVAASSMISGGLSSSTETTNGDLLGSWFRYFVVKDPDFDIDTMNLEEFYRYLYQSQAEWVQTLGAADPRLEQFRSTGAKLISWHGLADTILPPRGVSAYYDQVLSYDKNAMDFYRHFEAPGVGHCFGGEGPIPNGALSSLISWVENSTPPDVLLASSATKGMQRPLCPYPSRQVYVGGDSNNATSFSCTSIAP